jgi:hypothetical protein
VCPHCGANGAHTIEIERHTKLVDMDGEPSHIADIELIGGGKRYYCNGCGKNITKFIFNNDLNYLEVKKND